jgi:hypothetical protein
MSDLNGQTEWLNSDCVNYGPSPGSSAYRSDNKAVVMKRQDRRSRTYRAWTVEWLDQLRV